MNSTARARVEIQALERAENAEQTRTPQVWERRVGESAKAFNAFRISRDLAEKRTLAKVARALGCSSTNVERWARRWAWTQRTYEFDLQQEEEWRRQASRDRIAMRRRQIQLGQVLQSVAAYAIRGWQGRISQQLPLDIRPDEILAMLKLGNELEAKGHGEEKDGGKYTRIVVNFDSMPVEDFEAREYAKLSPEERAAQDSWKDPPRLLGTKDDQSFN